MTKPTQIICHMPNVNAACQTSKVGAFGGIKSLISGPSGCKFAPKMHHWGAAERPKLNASAQSTQATSPTLGKLHKVHELQEESSQNRALVPRNVKLAQK